MRARSTAAVGALLCGLVGLALAVIIAIQEFPRGLIALACVTIAAAAAWFGIIRRGPARIAGLAIGAAIAGNNHSHSYYRNSYYDGGYGYYGRPYGYYAPRTCISQERVWDPYIGHHVYVERRYPC